MSDENKPEQPKTEARKLTWAEELEALKDFFGPNYPEEEDY